jgi:M6 family metalloprotease-like protein
MSKIDNSFFSCLVAVLMCVNLIAVPSAFATTADLTPCQIQVPTTYTSHMRVGFPKDVNTMSSVGDVKILVLAIDFSDAPSSGKPSDSYNNLMQLDKVAAFYKSVSNGAFKPKFVIYPEYVRMAETSVHYGEILEKDELVDGEWESHHLTHDAMRQVDGKVKFSDYAGAIVVVSSGKSLSGLIALATSQDPGIDVHKTGELHNTILSGIQSFSNGPIPAWRVIIHEMNHLMGLADLYLYEPDGWWQGKSPGAYGQQGLLRGTTQSDSLAWNRWLSAWVPDSRVTCFSAPTPALKIEMSAPGTKDFRKEMIVIKLTDHTVLVIDALKEKGYEAKSKKNSILVYQVDSWVKPGFGPIQIISKKGPITGAPLSPDLPDWDRYKDATIAPGQSIYFGQITIKNNALLKGVMSLTIKIAR